MANPRGFLEQAPGGTLAIDDVQRVPALALKAATNADHRDGPRLSGRLNCSGVRGVGHASWLGGSGVFALHVEQVWSCADRMELWWWPGPFAMGPRGEVRDRETGSHPSPGDRDGLVDVSAAEEPAMHDEHMELVEPDSVLPAVSQWRFLVVGGPDSLGKWGTEYRQGREIFFGVTTLSGRVNEDDTVGGPHEVASPHVPVGASCRAGD